MNSAFDQDDPLVQDIAWLTECLRNVLRHFEGEAAATAVRDFGAACRDRRHGVAGAPSLAELLERVRGMELELVGTTVRAFTLYCMLVNTAEQVDRIRRRRNSDHISAGTLEHTLAELAAEGHDAKAVRARMSELEVRPVLTAHPTEATRKTLLALQARIADALLAREHAARDERQMHEVAIEAEVELLWLTGEVVRKRPSVRHEVSTALWYLEDRLLDAGSALDEVIERSFEKVFKEPLGCNPRIPIGSWVAGDRDGNRFVTPAETLSAARRSASTLVRYYLQRVTELMERLSLSETIARAPDALWPSLDRDRGDLPETWASKGRWHDDEPLRLKLAYMRERLARTLRQFEGREADHAVQVPGAYADADPFLADLRLVQRTLENGRAHLSASRLVTPLIDHVEVCGFAGLLLDVRQHAQVHTQTLDAMTEHAKLAPLDSEGLRRELLGRRPLLHASVTLGGEIVDRTREVFRTMATIQAESGEKGANTYIISMTKSADDLLRVLLLGREAGLVDLGADTPVSKIDVVPLFETGADLEAAPRVMKSLFEDEAYARQMRARGHEQEVMIGYSDSGKDIGILPAAWSLYRAQEQMTAVAREAGIALTLFHGLGGTVGRGGGSPVVRALGALPPGTIQTGIKITEQGEVISQKYGMLQLAERSLEIVFGGALAASLRDWRTNVKPEAIERFAQMMDALAEVNTAKYRRLVHEGDRLFEMFLHTTPVRELAHVHFGSRPVYRDKASEKMAGIRAIPWTFGWTQIRLMLPVWLGLGTALETACAQPGGLATLQEMTRTWPFFDDLLAKVEMIMAKADLEIARLYVEELGGDIELFEDLQAEFDRTCRALLQIRQRNVLLDDERLAMMLAIRDPSIDALSLFQVHLLATKRTIAEHDPRYPAVSAALGTTLSGVAQGLRNTG